MRPKFHVRKRRDRTLLLDHLLAVELNPEQCYRAIISRDPRFDGRFFVAVTSTGIYCRPVCPSKKPAFTNCQFFRHAAAAEVAGYRPCLRCRPELAPGHAPIDYGNQLATAAMKQIEAGSLDDQGISAFASRLGVSSRHLRRVFIANLGVTPIQLAQTHRLLLARQLLIDTNLPIIDVAFASGFSSVRRFNALFLDRYSSAPSQLRRSKRRTKESSSCVCRLSYRSPFDWESLLAFLSRRVFSGVEEVNGGVYRRTVEIGTHRGWLSVENEAARTSLRVEVSVSLLPVLMQVLARLRRLFDLEAVPEEISSRLGSLAQTHPGLRVPGAFDGFEMAVRAILGQQISVKAATTLAARLTDRFADSIGTPFPALRRLGPRAFVLSKIPVDELAAIGIPRSRAKSILALAQAATRGAISFEPAVSIDKALAGFKQLPGIGNWTAQYFAMRALRWPDAFPESDLGILKALRTKTPSQAALLAEGWRPWRAYAAMHLWKTLKNTQ
jgi:AraC family transcriptional regulator of adaptative response / DNA-3-methyladenine glycosylase II